MIKKMRILISNDDGIYSRGIVALGEGCLAVGRSTHHRARCGAIFDESRHYFFTPASVQADLPRRYRRLSGEWHSS